MEAQIYLSARRGIDAQRVHFSASFLSKIYSCNVKMEFREKKMKNEKWIDRKQADSGEIDNLFIAQNNANHNCKFQVFSKVAFGETFPRECAW